MTGLDVLKSSQPQPPEADEGALTTVTYPVPCERCGRVVRVGLNALRAPSFHHVAEQALCPEIQERRSKEDGNLLLMMCGSLKQSLAAVCDAAEVEASTPANGGTGRVVCSIPGVSIAQYDTDEARRRAEIWQAHGFDKLARRLRKAAAAAERGPRVWARAGAGLGALLLAAAGLWFFVAREPAPAPPSQPQTTEASRALADPPQAEPSFRMVTVQSVSAAPAPGAAADAVSETAINEAPPPQEQSVPPAADAMPAAPTQSPETTKVRLPDIVMIPGGTFTMGGTESAELPLHRVTIKPFALGKYPVTIGEWKECVADKACADVTSGPDDNPVTNVNYDDARDYLAWLSRTVGKPFRLPTEAEWEYAARGGASTKFWWGDQMRPGMANCSRCGEADAPAQLMKIGSFPANPFGLYDMGGGVDQWVADNWHKSYQGAPSDGSAWLEEQSFIHVIRSGSWKKDASYARSGSRDRYDGRVRYPTHGFRIALSL
ncbi:SUMF1/EgtB/PvdO family nonheme iron enzyme [Bradyrhizobium sp. ORS 375]|uniref:formylglycine-generating enzyme family protein n=1 Tax=Bradyrhizobium sp. (strain ORS 375) TaxID=566679 RepID=UPI0002DD594E|nr:SUMF1/EgtB/PvdO family nonheme iron enzyme [Bradyrhizobium sp. ORS 375]